MSALWIKICGTTRAEDAEAAAKLGADAVGLILFSASPRAVDAGQCASIFAALPENICRVAVLVNPDKAVVDQCIASGVIDLLQFHGEESEAFCNQFDLPYMKAIRVQNLEQAQAEIAQYPSAAKILLDRYQENVPGGTGKTFDWSVAEKIVSQADQEVILAGGLNPDNVAEAVSRVMPFGVDAVSGVEASAGKKDLVKMQKFIEASRSVRS